jgi:hypothetical protein
MFVKFQHLRNLNSNFSFQIFPIFFFRDIHILRQKQKNEKKKKIKIKKSKNKIKIHKQNNNTLISERALVCIIAGGWQVNSI